MNLMKLKTTFLPAIVALGLCSMASAQTTRVAYVDIDRVTEQSDKINTAMGNVQTRVEKIQKDIEEKRSRLVDVRAEIKKGDGVLAESELKKKRDEATKLEKELVDLEYEGRREMQKLDATLFEPMVKTIVLAIEEVAKEKNIDLVVRGEAVIYGANEADITDAVVEKLNSAAYNPGASKSGESEDEESTKSSSSAKDESSAGSGEAKDSAEGEAKRSIFPSVPLVTRPVDRQSD